MRLAFDIESDGLSEVIIDKKGNAVPEGTRVWCLVAQDIDTGNVWTFTGNDIDCGVDLLRNAELIVGHNITMFDIPFMLCEPLARLCLTVDAILSFISLSITTIGSFPSVESKISLFDFPTKYLWNPSTITYLLISLSKKVTIG